MERDEEALDALGPRFMAALAAKDKGRLDEAEDELRALLKIEPRLPEPRLELARILLDSGRLATALARHVPHLGGSPYAGFSWQGAADFPPLLLGLAFAVLAITGAIYLRRYYFEL